MSTPQNTLPKEPYHTNMSQLTSSWKDLPCMTTNRGWCAAAALNGKLYVAGGVGWKDSIESFDFNVGQWTQAASRMSRGRYGCVAAVIGKSVYVVGGEDNLSRSSKSVEAFDIESGLWSTVPSMRTKRHEGAAVAVGGELFVFGGSNFRSGRLNTAESYKADTRQWKDLPPMSTRRMCCAAAAIKNKIYVVGGSNEIRQSLDTVEVFDLTTRSWTLLPHRMRSKRVGCATAAIGNYLVVAGGYDGESYLNTVEMYDINAETWAELPPMSTIRSGFAAVALGGSVYVMGPHQTVEELQFSDDVVKKLLLEWTEGSSSDGISHILHRRTSVVHKMDVDITLMPTLLSNVGGEGRVDTVYKMVRGEIGIFKEFSKKQQKNAKKRKFTSR